MTGDFLTSLNNNCSLIHLLFFPYTYIHKPTHLYRNKIVGEKFTFPIFRIRRLQVLPASESVVVNHKNDTICFIAQYWWRLIFFTLSPKYFFTELCCVTDTVLYVLERMWKNFTVAYQTLIFKFSQGIHVNQITSFQLK